VGYLPSPVWGLCSELSRTKKVKGGKENREKVKKEKMVGGLKKPVNHGLACKKPVEGLLGIKTEAIKVAKSPW